MTIYSLFKIRQYRFVLKTVFSFSFRTYLSIQRYFFSQLEQICCTVKSPIQAASNHTTEMFLFPSCSCLCPIYWSKVLSREWRCNWCSAVTPTVIGMELLHTTTVFNNGSSSNSLYGYPEFDIDDDTASQLSLAWQSDCCTCLDKEDLNMPWRTASNDIWYGVMCRKISERIFWEILSNIWLWYVK